MTENWLIDNFSPDTEDPSELLGLFSQQYGQVEPARDDYFFWYCRDNPAGKAVLPIARDPADGKIIGVNWIVPSRARIACQNFIGSSWINAVVHRDYRRRHVFLSMVDHFPELMKEGGIDFGSGYPNDTSIKATPKIGWTRVGFQDLLARPLDWSLLGYTAIRKYPLIQKPVSMVANRLWPLLFHPRPVRAFEQEYRIEQVSRFNSNFDHFWEKVKDKYPIMYIRDAVFLNWRYTDHPTRTYYRLAAWHKDEMLGYIVVRATTFRKFPLGAIVDFLVEPSERGQQAGELLVQKGVEFLKQQKIGIIVATYRSKFQEGRILRRQGFLRLPKRMQPVSLLLFQLPLSESLPVQVLNENENWFFQLGDLDYF